jgi:hypothetical protein
VKFDYIIEAIGDHGQKRRACLGPARMPTSFAP